MTDKCSDEHSLKDEFKFCDVVINNILYGNGPMEKNEKLNICMEKLQKLMKIIGQLSLFSSNDDIEEMPTSSIYFLLTPAYLAFVLEEINIGLEERFNYLSTAKTFYRQYLENLLTYQLISFKLPWLANEDTEEKASSSKQPDFNHLSRKRQDKINRLNQKKNIEEKLEQLRIEQRRGDDETTERQLLLTLIRLWAIRSVESLSTIEEELEILEFMKNKNGKDIVDDQKNAKKNFVKPFIIAKTEAHKKVFGLGYPSIPTYTVDEWYDQMMESNGFGKHAMNVIPPQNNCDDDSDGKSDSEEEERERQKNIRTDEWKDMHRRGWGNTHNRG